MYRSGKKAAVAIICKIDPRPGIQSACDAGAQTVVRQQTLSFSQFLKVHPKSNVNKAELGRLIIALFVALFILMSQKRPGSASPMAR